MYIVTFRNWLKFVFSNAVVKVQLGEMFKLLNNTFQKSKAPYRVKVAGHTARGIK